MNISETYGSSFTSRVSTSPAVFSHYFSQAIAVNPLSSGVTGSLFEEDTQQLSIAFPTFNTELSSKVLDVKQQNGKRELTFESLIDSRVHGKLSITTKKIQNGGRQLREASLKFRATENRAGPLFLVDTLYALLGLGGQISVYDPDAKEQIFLTFNVSLPVLSELLQRRELYLSLMVIEKAFAKSFNIPKHISAEEVSSIFFSSRALLERDFIWRVNHITLPVPANAEMLAWFRGLKRSTESSITNRLQFPRTAETKTIFGQAISLGDKSVFIEDAIINNYEATDAALSRLDNKIVPITIKAKSRVGRYVFDNGPSYSNGSWDERLERLAELTPLLSQNLMSKYLDLMSVAIPELAPEQFFALLDPETIAKLADKARERRTAADKYLNQLLDDDQKESDALKPFEGLANLEHTIQLLPRESKLELVRFITEHLRAKENTLPPHRTAKSKRGFPISKGRRLFTSADVFRIDSET